MYSRNMPLQIWLFWERLFFNILLARLQWKWKM